MTFVTGEAGFLCSHLCEHLISEGNNVLCDDSSCKRLKDNIVNLLGNQKFEMIRHGR